MPELEYVGVAHLDIYAPTRRDVLLFDRLAVGGVGTSLARQRLSPSILADVQVLKEAHVLFDPGVCFRHLCEEWQPLARLSLGGTVVGWALREADTWLRRELRCGRDPNDNVAAMLAHVGADPAWLDSVINHARQFMLAADYFRPNDVTGALKIIDTITAQISTRLRAHDLSHADDTSATPLLPDVFDLAEWYARGDTVTSRKPSRETAVLSVVLKQFPDLREDVPWAEVLDFKSQLKSQQHDFHRWIRKVAKGDGTAPEIRDEIEGLVSDYTRFMEVHRAKQQMSRLETILVVTAEVAENLIRLRFGTLAKALVEFRNRDIALAEAELRAPGREVAYLAAARDRFTSMGARGTGA